MSESDTFWDPWRFAYPAVQVACVSTVVEITGLENFLNS
jgi:hypothetical protein